MLPDNLNELALKLNHRIKSRRQLHAFAMRVVSYSLSNLSGMAVNDPIVPGDYCGDPGQAFICRSSPTDVYSCGSSSSIPFSNCSAIQVFGCNKFKCTGTNGNFECSKVYDFACVSDFGCSSTGDGNSFTCDNKHIFECETKHSCIASFGCKSSSSEPCKGNYKTDGGKDTTSGDFLCGWPGGESDSFDCNTDFSCQTSDEFRCRDSTDFKCGSGNPTDKFECSGATTKFECDASGAGNAFNCNPQASFKCLYMFQCSAPPQFNCTLSPFSCTATCKYSPDDF